MWSARDGGGPAPCPAEVHRSYRWRYSQRVHRYLTAALAYRADLTNDGSIGPWLTAAARRAAVSGGPQNHHGACARSFGPSDREARYVDRHAVDAGDGVVLNGCVTSGLEGVAGAVSVSCVVRRVR
ncbi:hypothetical protein YW7DRAFT_05612 [Streptomyces sp. AmelKG-E11A]|nr:hypothetical protein YW7DRAFT_05612 [Streptomyces sp. AmelKG-E11A]